MIYTCKKCKNETKTSQCCILSAIETDKPLRKSVRSLLGHINGLKATHDSANKRKAANAKWAKYRAEKALRD